MMQGDTNTSRLWTPRRRPLVHCAPGFSLGAGSRGVKKLATSSTFDPGTLTLSGWWRSYAGAPWNGTASAGTSGSNNFTAGGADPTAGTLNSLGTATYNGTSQYLASSLDLATLWGASAGTIVALFNVSSAFVDTGAWYNNPQFISSNGTQEIGLGFSDSGVVAGNYDGTNFNRLAAACGTAGWHLASLTWDGVNLRLRVDSGAFTTQATNAISFTADTAQSGRSSYPTTTFLTGQIADMMTATSVLSDANLDNIKSYVNSRYSLSL